MPRFTGSLELPCLIPFLPRGPVNRGFTVLSYKQRELCLPVTIPGTISRLLSRTGRRDKPRFGLTTLETVDPPTEVVALTAPALPVVGMFGVDWWFPGVAFEAVDTAGKVVRSTLFALPVLREHVFLVLTLGAISRSIYQQPLILQTNQLICY